MKRFLLWLVGVVLGVGIFLGAVMGVSYAFTTEGGCPDSTAQFGTEALEPNGWCWQVPLIGGKLHLRAGLQGEPEGITIPAGGLCRLFQPQIFAH